MLKQILFFFFFKKKGCTMLLFCYCSDSIVHDEVIVLLGILYALPEIEVRLRCFQSEILFRPLAYHIRNREEKRFEQTYQAQ